MILPKWQNLECHVVVFVKRESQRWTINLEWKALWWVYLRNVVTTFSLLEQFINHNLVEFCFTEHLILTKGLTFIKASQLVIAEQRPEYTADNSKQTMINKCCWFRFHTMRVPTAFAAYERYCRLLLFYAAFPLRNALF